MRTLTGNVATERSAQYGADPIHIVKIKWGSDEKPKYYANQEFYLGSVYIENRILTMSSITANTSLNDLSSVGTFTLSLSDLDLEIKEILDSEEAVTSSLCQVYLYFNGTNEADLTLLFEGEIQQPIRWDEKNYRCELSFVSRREMNKLGFSLDNENLSGKSYETFVRQEAIGEIWPICMGDPVLVPADWIISTRSSPTNTDYFYHDWKGQAAPSGFPNSTAIIFKEYNPGWALDTNYSFCIDGYYFVGQFATGTPRTFTISERNCMKYNSNPEILSYSPTPAKMAYRELKLANSAYKLLGNWCVIQTKDPSGNPVHAANLCTYQYDDVCHFMSDWQYIYSTPHGPQPVKFDPKAGDTIIEVRRVPAPHWNTLNGLPDALSIPIFISAGTVAYEVSSLSLREVGDTMTPHGDVYILDTHTNSTLIAAYTQYRSQGKLETLRLPDDMYTLNTTDSYGGQSCTSLTIKEPHYLTPDSKWRTSKIWVTMDSSISSNVATQIADIINTYTGYTPDTTTFTAVATAIGNYPANYVLKGSPSPLKTIQQIAWQARCVLWINGDKVYIKYLSTEPVSDDFNIGEEDIEMGTLMITHTSPKDLVTEFIAEWKARQDQSEPFKYTVENNITAYGHRAKRFNFWIYNIEECVQKSADFWADRYANIWKYISFNTIFLSKLEAETFDTVGVNLDESDLVYGGSEVKGVIESVSYHPNAATMTFNIWLPILSGTSSIATIAWHSDGGDAAPVNPATLEATFSSSTHTRQTLTPNFTVGTGPGSLWQSSQVTGDNAYWFFNGRTLSDMRNLQRVAADLVTRFRVDEVAKDYLVCTPCWGTMDLVAANEGFGQQIYVAKPFRLQKTPFDKDVRAAEAFGDAYDARNGLVYEYMGATSELDWDRRKVTMRANDDVDDTVYQAIVPKYISLATVGNDEFNERPDADYIYAIYVPSGTGVYPSDGPQDTSDEDDKEILWMDLNVDGRAWATFDMREWNELTTQY